MNAPLFIRPLLELLAKSSEILLIAAIVSASALAQVAPEKAAAPADQAPPQILIDAKFIEVPAGAFPAADGAALNPEQAEEVVRKLQVAKGADFLSAPRVLTRSGQRATIQIGEDYLLPPGSTPKTKFVGILLEATPTLDGGTIKVAVVTEVVSIIEQAAAPGERPIFRERKTETMINVRDGDSVVLTKMPADKPGREIHVLLKVTTAPLGERAPAAPTGKAAKIILPKAELNQASVAEPDALILRPPGESTSR